MVSSVSAAREPSIEALSASGMTMTPDATLATVEGTKAAVLQVVDLI